MFLLLPYQTRFALRSLPLVTLALILVNALVYFADQARDDAAVEGAYEFYEASALPKIELPRYRNWLARELRDAKDAELTDELRAQLRTLDDALEAGDVQGAAALMESDAEFMRALEELAIVQPEDPRFLAWRDERNRFQALLANSTTERFALSRELRAPWRFVTYQFLHDDLAHWLGNMIVLLLAGAFAEVALGRGRFLAGYLLSGAAAGAAQIAVADVVLVGASGAIAGAMAMVAVLYGLRRVPVFYWVLFYFNTARLPALALLPVWIGNELLQWALGPDSDVAYMAHLAGLAAGALFAWAMRPRDALRAESAAEPAAAKAAATAEQARHRLELRARDAAAQLDTTRAATLYAELATSYPEHDEYAVAALNLALMGTDHGAQLDAARRILALRPRKIKADLRRAYMQLANTRALDILHVEDKLRLVRRLVRARDDPAAFALFDKLLADSEMRTVYAQELSDCLLGLFRTYARHRLTRQAEEVQRRLSLHFQPAAAPAAVTPAPTDASAPANTPAPVTQPLTDPGPKTLTFDLPR